MDHEWIDDAIQAMPGATAEFKPEWGVMVYRLAGKMIGMRGGYKDGRPILTLKLPPDQGQVLREQFDYVIPGYYSNKVHYNSVFLDTDVSREFIAELLVDARDCVFATLPKKTQAAMAGDV